MDFETTIFDNLTPRSSLYKPMDYEVADGLIDFPSTEVGLVDFDTTTLDDIDFSMTKSGLMRPATIDGSMLQFVNVDTHFMEFDFMSSDSVDFGNVDLSGNAGAPMDSGILGMDAAGFGMFTSRPTQSFTTVSDTVDPGTMIGQRVDHGMLDIDVLHNYVTDVSMNHHNLTSLGHLDLSTGETDVAGFQRPHSLTQTLGPSAAGYCHGSNEVGYRQHCRPMSGPHPTLPSQIYSGGSATKKTTTSDHWREYRPKCLDASATKAKIIADDWEEYRPFVEQLYVVENVRLKDVMQILQTRFGFVATEKMYKTKITQWGLMKNYKAAEKEHLARIVKAHRESGEGTPLLTLRNRAAKMSRVRRFCKQQKILEEICDALPTESSSNKEIPSSTEESPPRSTATTGVLVSALQGVQTSLVPSVPTLTKISFNPERPFSTASKDGRIELILLQMKIYFEYRFAWARKSDKWTSVAQPASQNAGNAADNVNTWRDKLVFGVGALVNQKSAQGWRLLDEACRIFHQVLDQQSQSLFENLFHAFTDSDWTTYRDISTHLLRFFTKVSVTRFGCNHPISIILYHLQEHQILTDAVTPAFEILMDVFGENGNPTDEEIWSIKANYCLLLTNRGDYAAAESYATRSLKQCGEVYGRLHWRTRMHLLELGDVYYCQSLYEPAERQYKDILQRGREDLGHEFPDDECIFALQHSAWICEERGDFAQSEDYWRAVLAGAIINWSMEDERATYLIAELEKSLKYHGMDPEAWLQQNFGISCV